MELVKKLIKMAVLKSVTKIDLIVVIDVNRSAIMVKNVNNILVRLRF